MKLRLRYTIFFMLLGAIVNVLVAWAMDLQRQPTQAQIAAATKTTTTPKIPQAFRNRPSVFLDPLRQPGWHQSGWPYAALLRRDRSPDDSSTWIVWRDGLRMRLPTSNPLDRQAIYLPVLPACGGLAVNTLFYAAVCWMIYFAPLAAHRRLRRWIRRRRGMCPSCAYPIGTSSVCTECGAAVTPKADHS